MKATLEYHLPEESSEFNDAMNGTRWSCVVSELEEWLRGLVKYHNHQLVTIEEVRARIRDLKGDL